MILPEIPWLIHRVWLVLVATRDRDKIFPQALARPCYKTKPKKLFLLSLENACSSYGSCSIGSKLKRNRASLCVVVQLKVPAVTT